MDYKEFVGSLSSSQPPPGLPETLQALWYDGKGNWERSHEIAQDIHDKNGSWIHAYLHRKEGDLSNARYWYAMAGKKETNKTLQEEWEELSKAFLGQAPES
jgi:hypothetical protein